MSAGNLTQESGLHQCAKPPKVLTVGAEGQQPVHAFALPPS